MFRTTLLHLVFLAAVALKLGGSLPRPYDGETAALLDRELSFTIERFERILKKDVGGGGGDEHRSELEMLLGEFYAIRQSSSVRAKKKLLENYESSLSDCFRRYLREQFDEQFLEEEILMEEWYLRQLLPELPAHLRDEVVALLPRYRDALGAPTYERKLALFEKITEHFSDELLTLLEGPLDSDGPLVNVHLELLKGFLHFLTEKEANEAEERRLRMHGDSGGDDPLVGTQFHKDLRALLAEMNAILVDDNPALLEAFIDRFYDDGDDDDGAGDNDVNAGDDKDEAMMYYLASNMREYIMKTFGA